MANVDIMKLTAVKETRFLGKISFNEILRTSFNDGHSSYFWRFMSNIVVTFYPCIEWCQICGQNVEYCKNYYKLYFNLKIYYTNLVCQYLSLFPVN